MSASTVLKPRSRYMQKEEYLRAAAIVRERPPAGAKDWNDAPRAQERLQERVEGRTQERERSPERGHGGVGSSERDDTPGHRW